jgi:hypothetical protein
VMWEICTIEMVVNMINKITFSVFSDLQNEPERPGSTGSKETETTNQPVMITFFWIW